MKKTIEERAFVVTYDEYHDAFLLNVNGILTHQGQTFEREKIIEDYRWSIETMMRLNKKDSIGYNSSFDLDSVLFVSWFTDENGTPIILTAEEMLGDKFMFREEDGQVRIYKVVNDNKHSLFSESM